jgi:protein TonB
MPGIFKKLALAACVLLLHLCALWGLQTAAHGPLPFTTAPVVISARLQIQFAAPVQKAAPTPAPPAPVSNKASTQVSVQEPPSTLPLSKAAAPASPPNTLPADLPLLATVATTTSGNGPAALASAAPSAADTVVRTAAPPKVELPSSTADYLSNPKPLYPPLSVRLKEQGVVVVNTYIDADGTARKVEIDQSSGFDRLDRAALAAALSWRYVPGKRAGVAQAMWVKVPIPFVLN